MNTSHIKILYIDDNDENLLVTKSMVEKEFPKALFLIASNGATGLEIALAEDPDVILMDIMMPDMDGFEVCRLLKIDAKLEHIPVAFITNVKGTNEMRIRAMEAGVAAYLEKPVEMHLLAVQINALVKVKAENTSKRLEKERLAELVVDNTIELIENHKQTLTLLEDLKKENEARKITEQALKASEELYRSVINASPDFIVVADLAGNVLFLSPAISKWYGYSDAAVLQGKNILEFVAPNDRQRVMDNMPSIPGTKTYEAAEFQLLRADGTIVETEINTEFTRDENGEPTHAVFVIRDISKRKLAEKELLESEEKYRFITEKITDVVWMMDLKGKSLFVSQSVEKFSGYTVEEYLAQTFIDRFTPASAFGAQEMLRSEVLHYIKSDTLPDNYKKTMYLEYKCKNGEIKTGEVIVTPYFDDNNTLAGLHGVTRDITKRKQMEIALRENEEKYRIISEQSPIAIELFNANGKLINVNKACLALFGVINQTELNGFSLFDDPNISDFHKNEIKEGKSVSYESEFDFELVKKINLYKTSKTGKIYLETNITPINKQGRFEDGYLVQIQDITDRKIADDLLVQTRLNYETFFNTIHDFLFFFFLQGNIIHTNNTVSDRLLYSKEELIGKSINGLHPAERQQEAKQIMSEMLSGIAESCSIPIVSKTGVVIPVETKVSHGFWNGNPVLFGVTKDVSEVKFSEEKFSKVFHVNPSACGLSDIATHKYVEVNEAFYNLFGFDKHEVVGSTARELGIISPETIQQIENSAKENGGIKNIEATLIAKNGNEKQVLLSAENIIVQNKTYRFTVVQDITARKVAEKNANHIARLYALLSEINRAIITCKTQSELFETICKVAVQYGQFRMGWFGILDIALGKIIPQVYAGHSNGYLDLLQLDPTSQSNPSGPTGRAFNEGEIVFCNDIANDPIMRPWRDEALVRGYLSSFATPIFRNGKSVGTFTLYASEVGFFDKDEQQLLAEIGQNISYAIDAIDSEIERKKVLRHLEVSELKYRTLMENSPEGITIYVDGRIVYANKETLRMMKATDKEDLLGKSIMDFIHPDNHQLILERMSYVATAPLYAILPPVEEKYIRLDGTEMFVEIKVMPIIYDGEPAIQLSGHDISDRKYAELALAETMNELKTIYDSAPIMMCVVDENAEIQFANQAFAEISESIINTIKGEEIGQVLGCMNAMSNKKGCGYGTLCDKCGLKLALNYTLQTGIGKSNIEHHSILKRGEEEIEIFFLASTALIMEGDRKRILLCLVDITDRRNAEVALKISEEKYRLLAENMHDGILSFDANKRINFVSESYVRQLGYSEKEELSKEANDISLIIHPDDREPVFAQIFGAIDAKKSQLTYLFRVKHALGHYIWREDSAMFNYDEKGSYMGAYVICRDISKRKQIEMELQLSETRLHNLFEYAPISIWEEDLSLVKKYFDELKDSGINNFRAYFSNNKDAIQKAMQLIKVVDINQTTLKVFGASSKEEILTNLMLKVDETNIAVLQEEFIALAEGQTHFEGETQIITFDGEKKDLLLSLTVMPSFEHTLSKVLISFIDITDRKQAQAALQKSEMFLRTFIENSPFEIWARDINSVGILENKKLVDNYGTIIGKKPSDDTTQDKKVIKDWETKNKRILNGEMIDETVELMLNKKKQAYQQIYFPIYSNLDIIGIAGFNINITERKRAEEALKKSQIQLKQFASHLQEVREEEKKLLAREIHDELGQILVALKIDLGLLRQKVFKKLENTSEDDVLTKFNHLYSLVDDTIKTTRKIMTNLRPEVLDLLGFIDTVKQYAKEFEERHQINCQFNCSIDKVEMSSQQAVALFRIVQESLTNVAKHAKATLVFIQLNAVDNMLVMEIVDNGVGFDQTRKLRTDSYGMIGMKERVFLLEGELTIVGKVGEGTSVKVKIPY